jgi:hypothetical protein
LHHDHHLYHMDIEIRLNTLHREAQPTRHNVRIHLRATRYGLSTASLPGLPFRLHHDMVSVPPRDPRSNKMLATMSLPLFREE